MAVVKANKRLEVALPQEENPAKRPKVAKVLDEDKYVEVSGNLCLTRRCTW